MPIKRSGKTSRRPVTILKPFLTNWILSTPHNVTERSSIKSGKASGEFLSRRPWRSPWLVASCSDGSPGRLPFGTKRRRLRMIRRRCRIGWFKYSTNHWPKYRRSQRISNCLCSAMRNSKLTKNRKWRDSHRSCRARRVIGRRQLVEAGSRVRCTSVSQWHHLSQSGHRPSTSPGRLLGRKLRRNSKLMILEEKQLLLQKMWCKILWLQAGIQDRRQLKNLE